MQNTKGIYKVNSFLWEVIAFPDVPTSIDPLTAH